MFVSKGIFTEEYVNYLLEEYLGSLGMKGSSGDVKLPETPWKIEH